MYTYNNLFRYILGNWLRDYSKLTSQEIKFKMYGFCAILNTISTILNIKFSSVSLGTGVKGNEVGIFVSKIRTVIQRSQSSFVVLNFIFCFHKSLKFLINTVTCWISQSCFCNNYKPISSTEFQLALKTKCRE